MNANLTSQESETTTHSSSEINRSDNISNVAIKVENSHIGDKYVLASNIADLEVIARLPETLQKEAIIMAKIQQEADIKRINFEQEQRNKRENASLEYNHIREMKKLDAEIKDSSAGKTVGLILGCLLLLVILGGGIIQIYMNYKHSGLFILGGGVATAIAAIAVAAIKGRSKKN